MNENNNKSIKRRCFVIGSSGYRDVDSLEWGDNTVPNIVDYDTVIVDVRSLDDEKLRAITDDFIDDIRTKLVRLLASGGDIIVLTDFKRTQHRLYIYPENINNYDWCPIYLETSEESGKTIVKKESRFESYLKHLKNWSYYLSISSRRLCREFAKYYGEANTEYNLSLQPFLTNRYNKVLAGSCRIEVRKAIIEQHYLSDSMTYPLKPDVVTGEIVLLPLLPDFDPKQAVTLVLEDLIGVPVRDEAPDWVDAILVSGVDEIQGNILQHRNKITKIRKKIESLESQRRALEDFKMLLFATGGDLEDSFAKAIVALGGKITPAKYGEEEYILQFDGEEYLIEVKGVSKSITLSHLRQLNDYILRYEEKTDKPCKGILFGNAWRTDPPDQRGLKKKIEFPDNVVKRATQLQIALLSSKTFFYAFCTFLSDDSLGKTILQQITHAEGIVNFSLHNKTTKKT